MSDQQGSNDLPAEDTSFLHNLLEPLQSLDWINLGWFAGVVFALVVLFAAGLKVPAEPHGAFYIYADCGRDARRFCLQLLESEAVAATPGVDFGANGTERYVRFAYTRAMADLEEAAARIRRFAVSSPGA